MDFNICYFDSTIWQIVPCISSCDRRVLTNFDRFSASRHCVVFSYELKKGCFEDFSATKLQASKIGSQSDRKAWNNKSKFILYICNSCSSNFVSIYFLQVADWLIHDDGNDDSDSDDATVDAVRLEMTINGDLVQMDLNVCKEPESNWNAQCLPTPSPNRRTPSLPSWLRSKRRFPAVVPPPSTQDDARTSTPSHGRSAPTGWMKGSCGRPSSCVNSRQQTYTNRLANKTSGRR